MVIAFDDMKDELMMQGARLNYHTKFGTSWRVCLSFFQPKAVFKRASRKIEGLDNLHQKSINVGYGIVVGNKTQVLFGPLKAVGSRVQ